jgi:hypothetical protein
MRQFEKVTHRFLRSLLLCSCLHEIVRSSYGGTPARPGEADGSADGWQSGPLKLGTPLGQRLQTEAGLAKDLSLDHGRTKLPYRNHINARAARTAQCQSGEDRKRKRDVQSLALPSFSIVVFVQCGNLSRGLRMGRAFTGEDC